MLYTLGRERDKIKWALW